MYLTDFLEVLRAEPVRAPKARGRRPGRGRALVSPVRRPTGASGARPTAAPACFARVWARPPLMWGRTRPDLGSDGRVVPPPRPGGGGGAADPLLLLSAPIRTPTGASKARPKAAVDRAARFWVRDHRTPS
eukprot:CAMPEP_0183512090 /NCGR_PEP_ID=MMETSP0371-20130417/11328_1 /TAXON_ID=268820 /ORGANISM="Peridinium aciculiferum, Strain PAER-2" /LENGTH=130 /DNA_ID=CAMNT_0025709109 /DNA_START=290 /DNA_END=679 /DNA_ORIENTATION=+